MVTTDSQKFLVDDAASGQRLDRFLAVHLADASRTRAHTLIADGHVLVNGQPARPSQKVAPDDEVAVTVPPPPPLSAQAEAIPLQIIYEDADVLVIDKQAGLVVHPSRGHSTGTLVNALLGHTDELAEAPGDDPLRPGIVHRLDRDTSGVMVVAKHERALRGLADQFRLREMGKQYVALVDGAPRTASGTIDAPIGRSPRNPQRMDVVAGGRRAVTHFLIMRRFARHTLLECRPETGRTHQIRVHLAALGCPVCGDRTYGRPHPTIPLSRHFLHAASLTLTLPSGERRTFEAPMPPELEAALQLLESSERD